MRSGHAGAVVSQPPAGHRQSSSAGCDHSDSPLVHGLRLARGRRAARLTQESARTSNGAGAARSAATTARRLQGPATTVPSLPSPAAAAPPPRTHAQRRYPTARNRKLTSSGLLASSVMQLTAITDRINLSNSLRATMLLHNWRNVRLRLASTGTATAGAFGEERPAWPAPTVCSPGMFSDQAC